MNQIVVLISGRGSNMRALIDACDNGELSANVVAVISNNPDAQGLGYAKSKQIPTAVIDHKQFTSREAFDTALQKSIDGYSPNWVALAGFMRILTAPFVNHFLGKLINIHPSLLPKYPGLNTHAQALEAGDTTHGASVHFVIPELDAGPVIAQSSVPVLADDTESTLAKRVLNTEHELYVKALQLCVLGKARYANEKCYLES